MCSGPMTGPGHSRAARSMALRSSRTLPGQSCASSRRAASAPGAWARRRRLGAENARPAAARRPGARAAAECTGTTWSRYQRSSRKRPCLTASGGSRCVAAMMRTFTGSARLAPTGVISRSCSARRILACVGSGMSPTSSRNSVPPCASRKRPARSLAAPVKAPFTWPKSSLSIRSAGMAAQLTATKGRSARTLLRCRARATSSLPVPVSPSTSTVASLSAARPMRLKTCRMASLPLTSSPSSCICGWPAWPSPQSWAGPAPCSARSRASTRAVRAMGLVRWSKAPRRMASMVLPPLA